MYIIYYACIEYQFGTTVSDAAECNFVVSHGSRVRRDVAWSWSESNNNKRFVLEAIYTKNAFDTVEPFIGMQ